MSETPRIRDARHNVLVIEHPVLPEQPQTTLTAASAAGAVALTVADNSGLSNGDKLVVGQAGSDQTEIATIGGAVTPGTALTVAALTFAHPVDCPVRRTLWNQIKVYSATAVGGSLSLVATIDIQFGSDTTDYVISGTAAAYYVTRYYDSVTAAVSSDSDYIPSAGYSPDTVRLVKETALEMTGQQIGDVITDDFLNQEIVNCENELYRLGPGRRWAHFLIENASLGTLTAGETVFSLPSDIADDDTNGAIQNVHTRQVMNLRCVEKREVDEIRWDVALAKLASNVTAGDTTVTLDDVGDFHDDGSVTIGEDTVTYTARDTTTNILSGIPASGSGSFADNHTAGDSVWQGGQIDMTPTLYFIYPGYLELPLPPNASYWDQNLYIDYYSKPTFPNSDADLVNFPSTELYHYYLSYKIKLRLANGVTNDSIKQDFSIFEDKKEKMMGRARLQDAPRFRPRRLARRQDIGRAYGGEIVYFRLV
jgi:hypothetical protein